MMNSRPDSNPRLVLQRGASLIEVMVALFVLAIGLLGFAGLQTEGVMIGRKAYVQSQAIFLAEDIIERMRANRGALTNYVLVFGESPTAGANCGPSGTSCSANELAAWDVQEWETLVANSVPAGDGEVEVTSVGGLVARCRSAGRPPATRTVAACAGLVAGARRRQRRDRALARRYAATRRGVRAVAS